MSAAPSSVLTSFPDPDGTDQHAALHAAFRWVVPADFNIGQACCARWAAGPAGAGRPALIVVAADGAVTRYDFATLQAAVTRLGHALQALGVTRGDRVALVLSQGFETAVAHLAVYQIGAVVMPLSALFGPEALAYRLQDSAARVAIVDGHTGAGVAAVRAACPALRQVIEVGASGPHGWAAVLAGAATTPVEIVGGANDPAVLIYTSGTTGAPKGALLPHQALLGNLPGFVLSQAGFPQEDAVFWSPADWAWTGGLMDALLPTLYFGMPIVATSWRFDAERAFEVMAQFGVTNTFLFPTALKMMMKAVPDPRDRFDLRLRAVMSGGEAVGRAVFDWCRSALGVTVNEIFGQTEVNYLVGNAHGWWPARPGSIGRPYPGHEVAVLDESGQACAPDVVGEIAVRRQDRHGTPDPVFFLGYWQQPVATAAKFSGDWCRTGDLASVDTDGYFWYRGRADDVFKAAGYRIGPAEVEDCLVRHPAVENAAVVPRPDPMRGNLVKAYVVLAPGYVGDAALIATLQDFVRGQLAPYEYPREIECIAALPMTTTGKVQRRVLRLQEEERAARRTAQG